MFDRDTKIAMALSVALFLAAILFMAAILEQERCTLPASCAEVPK